MAASQLPQPVRSNVGQELRWSCGFCMVNRQTARYPNAEGSNSGDQPALVLPNNSAAEPPDPAPVEDSSPVDKTEPTDLPAKCICKPTPLLREILEGRADGGTAHRKSRIPKGAQLPIGMTATEDNHEIELECVGVDVKKVFKHIVPAPFVVVMAERIESSVRPLLASTHCQLPLLPKAAGYSHAPKCLLATGDLGVVVAESCRTNRILR